MYQPKPFIVPMTILTPSYDNKLGVEVKTWTDGRTFVGSFATYGGTDSVIDGILTVTDTVKIETAFSPDITSDCRIRNEQTGATYDVMGEPEDIESRHIFTVFKAKRVKGGA
jgi:SPP1 family predicted phage head-tail adaptor